MITVNKLDRDLLYLSSDPVAVNGFPVYPVTIRQIRQMGYIRYRTCLALLTLTDEDVAKMMKGTVETGVPFFFLLSVLAFQEDQRDDIVQAFRMVCREDIEWDEKSLEIRSSSGVLTSENFLEFQNVVRERNKYDTQTVDENPADEYTRQLQQKSREMEARRAKQRGDGEGVTLVDLISICAAKLQVHPDAIGDFDMYQLNDALGRFKMFDDYEVNIQALLHGAKKEDIDLSHWISGNKSLFKE
ncbi:MAG: hypothetical protein J6S14_17280 [Clostridia bacterium]|nr:hypothetical protein [Clostridia bacterium]